MVSPVLFQLPIEPMSRWGKVQGYLGYADGTAVIYVGESAEP